jgi:hypothetical protein
MAFGSSGIREFMAAILLSPESLIKDYLSNGIIQNVLN